MFVKLPQNAEMEPDAMYDGGPANYGRMLDVTCELRRKCSENPQKTALPSGVGRWIFFEKVSHACMICCLQHIA